MDRESVGTTTDVHFLGPYFIDSSKGRVLDPPEQPGLYLWAFERDGQYFINYVGQASNLRSRFYAHISGVLGGRYQIYESESVSIEDIPRWHDYRPGLSNLLGSFIVKAHEVARENLRLMRFFYSADDILKDKETRMAIESSLITAIKKGGRLQNERVSISSHKSKKVCVKVTCEVALHETVQLFNFGTL